MRNDEGVVWGMRGLRWERGGSVGSEGVVWEMKVN